MNDFFDWCIAIICCAIFLLIISIDEPPRHAFSTPYKESREPALAEEAGRPIDPTAGFGDAPVRARASQ
jgi:hypothetical protein